MRTLLTVLLLLLIPLNLHAQEPAGGEGAAASFPHFESAYFKNGHIEFKPSVKFDWESGASEKIKSINTGKPTQKDIDYIKSGDHFFPYYSLFFELGVPGDMSKAFYYLIIRF